MSGKYDASDFVISTGQSAIMPTLNISDAEKNVDNRAVFFMPSIFNISKLDLNEVKEGALRAHNMGFNSILTKELNHNLIEFAHEINIKIFLEINVDSDFMEIVDSGDFNRSTTARGSISHRLSDTDVDFLKSKLLNLSEQGIDGFVCHSVAAFSAQIWKQLIQNIQSQYGDVLFFAFCPGLTAEQREDIKDANFTYSISSSCWWDFNASWLNDETLQLKKIAPPISLTSIPNVEYPSSEIIRRRAITLAAMFGAGWIMEAGFEKSDDFQLALYIKELNQIRDYLKLSWNDTAMVISSSGSRVALLACGRKTVLAINRSHKKPVKFFLDTYSSRLSRTGVIWSTPRQDIFVESDVERVLLPAEVQIFEYKAAIEISNSKTLSPDCRSARIAIEDVSPKLDDGGFPVRRVIGDTLTVEADFITDGHDKIAAEVLFRPINDAVWQSQPMRLIANDRWRGDIMLPRLGRYIYAVRAWRDQYGTIIDEIKKKQKAGVNVDLEISEAMQFIEIVARRDHNAVKSRLLNFLKKIEKLVPDEKRLGILSNEIVSLMREGDVQTNATQTAHVFVDAERKEAQFANWYEIFPRSQSGTQDRHGTFRDVIEQLPRVAAMGFDVLYFPPIHPIGRINRKGKNNSLVSEENDVGSPYAIGNENGGHDAIHPALGDINDFLALIEASREHKIEIALDFAIQCAPDHPWLKEHPEWFNWRPDGTVKYAENPPKKYEDIVNVDFYADGAQPALWTALRDIVEYWVSHGIKIFRVDNPHTKPLPFWEWMIRDIRGRHPDVIFLAEAFTRPKLMYRLAKIGFSQSYTYFTWRNKKQELQEYLTELTTSTVKEYFRPHFFVNTPDINPEFLQHSGRAGFLIRAALAATLSGLWGVYNGFELCEAASVSGKEEYLDSEKYQIRVWDHTTPGNIIAEITQLNYIRRTNAALQTHLNVQFHTVFDDQVIFFSKMASDGNAVLIVVSLDPYAAHETTIELPLWLFGLPDDGSLIAEDLMRGHEFIWHGKYQPVKLHSDQPFCIWRVEVPEGE